MKLISGLISTLTYFIYINAKGGNLNESIF